MTTTVYFREVKEPHIRENDESLRYWHIEAYEDGRMMFPVGIAYVVEVPSVAAQLQFIFVADQWRRHGVGKCLVNAIKCRWPSVMLTSAIDERGAALLSSAGIVEEEEDDCG